MEETILQNFSLLGGGNESLYLNCSEYHGAKRDSLYVVVPITIIYVTIFLTGTIGNISTCIVIFRNKVMHTATNYYLFSLTISDLLLLISGLPQEIYLIWSRYPYIFGSAFCFLRGLCAETSSNATVLTITAFTVERYLAICHPFLSHTMSKLSRVVKFILMIWVVSIGLAIPQAMQFGIVGHGDCVICAFIEPIIPYSFEVSTVVFFITPMTMITVLYILIGLRLQSSNLMATRNTNSRLQSKSSKKVIKMLVAVVIAFFICWAPFHAQRLYTLYSTQLKHTSESHVIYFRIYVIVTYISGILFYMSATVNPILYNIMSVKFRDAFKETFTRCCGFGRLQHSGPQRTYSMLSRSAQRGIDSTTDSGKEDHTLNTHTTLTQKSYVESFNGTTSNPTSSATGIRQYQTSTSLDIKGENLLSRDWSASKDRTLVPATYLTIHVERDRTNKLSKVLKLFHWITGRRREDKHVSLSYHESPRHEPRVVFEMESPYHLETIGERRQSSFDISNSSLKDVESMAIEDELTAYMKEIQMREC